MIVADTDVLIDSLHGVEPGLGRVAEKIRAHDLSTTALTVFDLCVGARTDREQAAVDVLLSALPVLPVDDGVARLAATVQKDLQRVGLQIGFADALIAAACLLADASLLTRNTREFGRVPGLKIEPLRA